MTHSWMDKVLSLFPETLYTDRGIFFEDDLKEAGLTDALDTASPKTAEQLYHSAETLSAVKPELAFHFLRRAPRLIQTIEPKDLENWVQACLNVYDAQGLHPARDFIVAHKDHSAFPLKKNGVYFENVSGGLQNFLYGLGGEDIGLKVSHESYTDGLNIFLPDRFSVFSDRKQNFLLYKLSIAHKMAQLRLGTYRFRNEAPVHPETLYKGTAPSLERLASDLSRFFHRFPEPRLAGDLFLLADTLRTEAWIQDHFPGLFRRLVELKRKLAHDRTDGEDGSNRTSNMEALTQWYFSGYPIAPGIGKLKRLLSEARDMGLTTEAVADIVEKAYAYMPINIEPYHPMAVIPYVGILNPEAAEAGFRCRRESLRLDFQRELAKLIEELPDPEDVRLEFPERSETTAASGGRAQRQEIPDQLMVDDRPVPIPEALQKIIQEIYEDLGSLPSSYLTVADDMTGHYFHSACQPPEGTGYFLSEHAEGVRVFDEWDHRRQGYRKNWALLKETDADEGDWTFVEETKARFGGMIQQIRRRFESIRRDEVLMRRQKDGDEIDLDAAVEGLSDMTAGHTPSERFFVRLRRDQRNIATAFLIDLSGSTKGWINETERMALFILCEAMAQIEDRFAIYGFSGQTRKRCELYRIKGFDEPYGDRIQKRIAGIRAREYTRMGPPIRCLTDILGDIDARAKLLITLSDGKPDDYDAYNGEYGIEDTRQALLEAKKQGIHPFCITIDKAEHNYLSHMYGHASYVFIDDLAQLPLKIPEIYRKLTT